MTILIKAITDDNLKEKTAKGISVIDLWARWCSNCPAMSMRLEHLEPKYSGKINFYKLDIDENQKTPTKLGIKGIPTLLIYKDGKLVNQTTGAMPMAKLNALLNKYIK